MLQLADCLQSNNSRLNRDCLKRQFTGKVILGLAIYLLFSVLPVHAQGLTSLLVTGGDHAYFVDAKQHVNQMYSTGSGWVFQDLTLLSNAPVAAVKSEVTSLLITGGDHVYFFDLNWHLAQLYYSGSGWIYQDLTAFSRLPDLPVQGSSIASVLFGGHDYVYYQGADKRIKQLWFTGPGSGWVGADIMPSTPPVLLPAPGSKFSIVNDGVNLHLFYSGPDQHIDRLKYDAKANQWIGDDLSAAANPSATLIATSNSSLSSLFLNNMLFLYYFSSSMHINQLVYDGASWHNFDLTFASHANVVAAANSGLTSFNQTSGRQFVCYVDPNEHVDQLLWNTDNYTWTNQDLTASSGTSTQAAPQADLTSLVIGSGGAIYYTDTTGHINKLSTNNLSSNTSVWVNQDLTAASIGSPNNAAGHSSYREYIRLGSSVVAIENVKY